MACPNCNRIYCDHTPNQRGQSEKEMLADMNYGHAPLLEKEPSVVVREERARKALKQFGIDGMATAVNLVGPRKAARLLVDVQRKAKIRRPDKKRKAH